MLHVKNIYISVALRLWLRKICDPTHLYYNTEAYE